MKILAPWNFKNFILTELLGFLDEIVDWVKFLFYLVTNYTRVNLDAASIVNFENFLLKTLVIVDDVHKYLVDICDATLASNQNTFLEVFQYLLVDVVILLLLFQDLCQFLISLNVQITKSRKHDAEENAW